MRIVSAIFLIFTHYISFTQIIVDLEEEDLKKMEFAGVFKSSIAAQIGGTAGIIGASYDLLVSEKIRIEVGGGYVAAGIGVKVYPFSVKREKVCFNFGVRSQLLYLPQSAPVYLNSLPIGFTYFGLNRLNYEIDFGPALPIGLQSNDALYGASKFLYGYASFKIGYRFSFYNMRRIRQLND